MVEVGGGDEGVGVLEEGNRKRIVGAGGGEVAALTVAISPASHPEVATNAAMVSQRSHERSVATMGGVCILACETCHEAQAPRKKKNAMQVRLIAFFVTSCKMRE